MGLRAFDVSFRDLRHNPSIRLWKALELPPSRFPLSRLSSLIETPETGSRPVGGIRVFEGERAISLGGEQIHADGSIDLTNTPYVPIEFYRKAKKGKVRNDDILVCKDGALTGKACIADGDFPIDEVMANEHVYVLRSGPEVQQRFLFYLIGSRFVQMQIRDLSYRKKGQPGLNLDHIDLIRVPKIPIADQLVALKKIEPSEKRIRTLKAQTRSVQRIIDSAFAESFDLEYDRFDEINSERLYVSDFQMLANNPDVRFSTKFHRPAGRFVAQKLHSLSRSRVKDYLSEPIVLGKGISPHDYDESASCRYLSMATIKTWEFDEASARSVSNAFAASNTNKRVKKGDIVMARSGEGTIGKAALIDDDVRAIFADFVMRIRLRDYNLMFAYYYFRSRYFQYLVEINKKGLGNNTNIFPGQIQEFPLLDIAPKEQEAFVDRVQATLTEQRTLEAEISSERAKISSYVAQVIEQGV